MEASLSQKTIAAAAAQNKPRIDPETEARINGACHVLREIADAALERAYQAEDAGLSVGDAYSAAEMARIAAEDAKEFLTGTMSVPDDLDTWMAEAKAIYMDARSWEMTLRGKMIEAKRERIARARAAAEARRAARAASAPEA